MPRRNASNTPEIPAVEIPAEKLYRMTGFDSKGSRFFRITLPREWAKFYESPANLWTAEIDQETGVITYSPIRPLVRVTPKVPRGAAAE